MDKETKLFKENIDAWIKQIRSEFSEITDVSDTVEENIGNIQHNYELIHHLKEEVEQMKQDVETLKLIGLVQIEGGFTDV